MKKNLKDKFYLIVFSWFSIYFVSENYDSYN